MYKIQALWFSLMIYSVFFFKLFTLCYLRPLSSWSQVSFAGCRAWWSGHDNKVWAIISNFSLLFLLAFYFGSLGWLLCFVIVPSSYLPKWSVCWWHICCFDRGLTIGLWISARGWLSGGVVGRGRRNDQIRKLWGMSLLCWIQLWIRGNLVHVYLTNIIVVVVVVVIVITITITIIVSIIIIPVNMQ